MLASIHPLGERARRNRWTVTVTAYLAASAVGGALVGTLAGGTGWAVRHAWQAPGTVTAGLAAAGALVAAAWDASSRGGSLPPRRQVNEDWLASYRGWVYGAGFGVQLGAGVTTIITTATVPLTLWLAFLTSSPAAGAVVGVVFGAARAAPALALRGVADPATLRRFHVRMQAAASRARWAAAASAALAGAALVGGGVLPLGARAVGA